MLEINALLDRKPTARWERELKRREKVRLQMRKRTQPDDLGDVYTLGYNCAVARKSDGAISIYTGSSLNRKKNAKVQETNEAGTLQGHAEISCRADFFKLCDTEAHLSETDIRNVLVRNRKPVKRRFHVLADRSRGKVRDKFSAFYAAARGKNCTFCTLTFVQSINDGDAVKVLNKFMTSLRGYFKQGINYIWVAERQKNGNIHFHLLLDHRLPIRKFNSLWVMQQYNWGLMGYSRTAGRVISADEIRVAFDKNKIHLFFNPLDIKDVYSLEGLSFYLTKYVTKNRDSFECLAWHCSRTVSRMFIKVAVSRAQFMEVLSCKNSYVNKETGEYYQGELRVNPKAPFCGLVYIYNKNFFKKRLKVLEEINRWVLYENFVPDIVEYEMAEYYQKIFNDQLN